MKKPPPDNLGSRQRALNEKVNSAVASKVPFEKVENESEDSEVDKLFKIDVAARYKKVDYIIGILRSGDSLYTSRALKKAEWLYHDEFSHIINPEYLQDNLFSFTSAKLKRKILKTAAAHITNPQRAGVFFRYFMEVKMINTALTCLLHTTEEFKLEQLRNNNEPPFRKLQEKDILYIRFFVGKSFILLEAFLSFINIPWKKTLTARQFKNFYSNSEEKYLDIAEKYVSTYFKFQTDKFDSILSESIMKNHKHRVMSKPEFYVNVVNTNILLRYSTIDDVKVYAAVLLPKHGYEFWSLYHYTIFSSVFKIIPHDKTYAFFKDFFTVHYPDTEFEMHSAFYKQEYYRFMTHEQREEWAFRHLKSEKQVLGVGLDYLWYRFINFDLAYIEIKNYISVTKDATMRNNMAEVLIESARNDRELETLFKYYTKRHMSEERKHRDSFVKKVLTHHNLFHCDENCWNAFYMLLLGMDLYNKQDTDNSEIKNNNRVYKSVTLLYVILHHKEIPEELMVYFLNKFEVNEIRAHLEKISKEEKQELHEYMFSFFMDNITLFRYKEYNKDVESRSRRYYNNMKQSIELFNKDGEVYEKHKGNNRKKIRHVCSCPSISARSLLRDLKKDKGIVINKVSHAKYEFEGASPKLNSFLNKIQIYFPNDVAQVYLEMFKELILNDKLVNGNCHRMKIHVKMAVRTGVNAIFHLGSENDKINFMQKYLPVNMKIDYKNINMQELRIQRAICRYACIARPPVPMPVMLMYMKGDYAKHCLHVFNSYRAILPLPMCRQFVHLVIDAPVSIQKHAIRLAFQCFTTESLREAMIQLWKGTQNVSLRSVIYKALLKKVIDGKETAVFEVLKTITFDLHPNDEADIFNIIESKDINSLNDFLGEYVLVVWQTVNKFKDIEPNLTRKRNVIICMYKNLHLMREDFVMEVVNEHINTMLVERKLHLRYSNEVIAALYKEKWLLVAHYIIHFTVSATVSPQDKRVEIAQFIFRKNIENWNDIAVGIHIYRQCCWDLLNNLKKISVAQKSGYFEDAISVFEGVQKLVNSDLPYYESYFLQWELDLSIVIAKVLHNRRGIFKEEGERFDAVIEAIKEFSERVGKLVSVYVEKEGFFLSFSWKIEEIIQQHFNTLLKIIYEEIEKRDWIFQDLNNNEALVTLAAGLVKFELAETHLLAVEFLPSDMNKNTEAGINMHKNVIEKLLQFPHAEVQLSVFQKLCKKLRDCCHR